MADTLIREGIAYGSQPLSPVPQYWNGSSYAKVQGTNGAIRVINYDSAGETFTDASPGSVTVVSSAGGSAVFNSSSPGVIQIALSAGGSAAFSNAVPGTVQLITSAGATNLFSGANPASVQLTATSTVDVSTVPVVGTQANAWSAAATVSAGATSNSIDLQYNYRIGYFGEVTNTAALTLYLEVSQNNSAFYTAASASITAGTSSPFHYSTETAARYARLVVSGVSATITATIAGK